MFLIGLVVLIVVSTLIGAGIYVRHRGPPAFAPSRDVPGVRSALIFERLAGAVVDGESIPDPELLDAIAHGLERDGAEPGPWRADREGTVELAGLMLGDAFLLTLGPVSPTRWQLHVYAQPLGGARYAAPPRTESMKAVLRTVDRAVRALPDVIVLGWQTRQDSFHGQPNYADTPTD